MIDLLNPLTTWQEKYPDGFTGTQDAKLHVFGKKLMIGADVKMKGVERLPANVTAQYRDGHLDITVKAADAQSYDGLVVAVYAIEVPEFDTLRLHSAETNEVELGRFGVFNSLAQGEAETPFGTINEMVAFALGHTTLECFSR